MRRVWRTGAKGTLVGVAIVAVLAFGVPTMAVADEPDLASLKAGFEEVDGFEFGVTEVNGTRIGYRTGGSGPAMLLIHGFPESGRTWSKVADDLARRFTVIVPDYRGACGSAKPSEGYDKATMADDLLALVRSLGHKSAHVVGHDIGMIVAFAYARDHPDEVETLTLVEAVIPGTDGFEKAMASGAIWQFPFHADVSLASKLIAAKPAHYLDHYFSSAADGGAARTEANRRFYLDCYGSEKDMAASIRPYATWKADAEANRAFLKDDKLSMPVLVIGGEASLGAAAPALAEEIAEDSRAASVEDAGHFVQEERPERFVELLLEHAER